MDEYQISALREGSILIIIMIGASCIYFASSKNTGIRQRILVSMYPMLFLLGEIFALVGSNYYERGSWLNGEYVRTDTGEILTLLHSMIFISGILMSIYTFAKFEGDKLTKFLALPVYFAALLLWFISGMTLTRDWL